MSSILKYIFNALTFIFKWFAKQWKDLNVSEKGLFKLILFSTIPISTILTIVIIVVISYFKYNIGFQSNRISFGENYPLYLKNDEVYVNPVRGWQFSGVKVKKEQKISLMVTGKVHVGLEQIVNLMNCSKGMIAYYSDEADLRKFSSQYHFPDPNTDKDFTDKLHAFRRTWTSDAGQQLDDEMLSPTLLKPTANWGSLLCVVLPINNSDLELDDPIKVLKDYKVPVSSIFVVNQSNNEITIPNEGYLYFIVNDACPSPESDNLISNHMYKALASASDSLRKKFGNLFLIEKSQIPLFWYQDNIGNYIVYIK